ncbi:MAG: hypothetical protein ACXVDD_10055 [Polyangia bacterium]|jgi:hypothetical protein
MAHQGRRDDERASERVAVPEAAVSFVALLDAEEESSAQAARFVLHAAERSFHDHTCDGRPRRNGALRR